MPHRTAIGGDVFVLAYDARSREVSAYNGSGGAPRVVDRERFAAGFPEQGAILATVPGAIGALADLAADHGRLGLDRALAPAIAYAEDGFPVSDLLAQAAVEEGEGLRAARPVAARRGDAPATRARGLAPRRGT